MTGTAHRPVVLIGPPGAGCSTVARALAQLWGATCLDLGAEVARRLGTHQDLALVAIPEADYRRAEEACALELIEAAGQAPGVLALGSGCLSRAAVAAALEDLEATSSGHVVALDAPVRILATRNGLDAPRSVALGAVHHEFTQMLRARQARCAQLATLTVDTSRLTPTQAAWQIAAHLDQPRHR